MPYFVIHALDNADSLATRLENYAAHRSYVEAAEGRGIHVVLSGPLQSADGDIMIGSLLIVEAEARAAVTAFTESDPFRLAGVWGRIDITRFHKRKG